jgi:hypothetical protein
MEEVKTNDWPEDAVVYAPNHHTRTLRVLASTFQGQRRSHIAHICQHDDFESPGAIVPANTCGPWIGRSVGRGVKEGEKKTSASFHYDQLTFPC